MNKEIALALGFSIIFLATTLGSALVFCLKKDISVKLNCFLLGLSSGIMLASSIWSLILPAIEQSSNYGKFNFMPACIGFVIGGLFLIVLDKIAYNLSKKQNNYDILQTKPFKLFMAITIHNIPEGLAVGFAFGAASIAGTLEAYLSALGLSIGIAIQNLPEGAAVSLPFKAVTNKKLKAFLFGMFSGIVEPIAAIIGYFLASFLISAQPWLLSFAAGAMFFVVVEELIPESKYTGNFHLGSWGAIIGFVIMMALDVALG